MTYLINKIPNPLSLFLLAIFFSFTANAVPENELESTYKNKILPFYLNKAFKGTIIGKKNKKVAFYRFSKVMGTEKSKGVLILLPGSTEAAMKYIEVAYDFMNLGYTIYVLNHRGQGLSEKLTDPPGKNYIDNYKFLLDDIETFIQWLKVNHSPKEMERFFMIGHSMGGGVLSKFLTSRNLQNKFKLKGAILCSPMLQPKLGKLPKWLIKTLINTLSFFGLEKMDAPSRGRSKIKSHFESNKKTHSKLRYENIFFLARKFPSTWLSGITIGWLTQVFLMIENIDQEAKNVHLPLLLIRPQNDAYVWSNAQDKFCENAKNCQQKIFPKAYHELLMEKDPIRNRAFQDILNFMEKQ